MILILIPIIWIISLGFRYPNEIFRIFPTRLTLENIPKAISLTQSWLGINFFKTYLNSIIISFFSIIGIVIISSLAAFGFSQYKFKGKELIFILLLVAMMIPLQVMLIPIFILMKNLNLLNTYLVLILPYIALGSPISILILRGFFEEIPMEIKEAAKIDGASDFRVFLKIILPLAKGAMACVMIFSFLFVWNEFILALTFLKNDQLLTVPVSMNRMIGAQFAVNWELYGALIALNMIPILVLFIIFQKWFIAGLTAGAIKG